MKRRRIEYVRPMLNHDAPSRSKCRCREINGPDSSPCPRHHPTGYTTWGARHKGLSALDLIEAWMQ